MLDSTEVLEAGGAAAGWREVARFPYAAQGLAGAHNFVEYQKAGREGKISTLPAQAVTGHSVHYEHPDSLRLSDSK